MFSFIHDLHCHRRPVKSCAFSCLYTVAQDSTKLGTTTIGLLAAGASLFFLRMASELFPQARGLDGGDFVGQMAGGGSHLYTPAVPLRNVIRRKSEDPQMVLHYIVGLMSCSYSFRPTLSQYVRAIPVVVDGLFRLVLPIDYLIALLIILSARGAEINDNPGPDRSYGVVFLDVNLFQNSTGRTPF